MLRLFSRIDNSAMAAGRQAAGTKPTVAIDVDGTLANVFPVVVSLVNDQKGTHYSYKSMDRWSPEMLGVSHQEFHAKYIEAWKDHWHEIMPLVESAPLEALARNANVYLLTGMDPELVPSLRKWLRDRFPSVAEKISICSVESMKRKLAWGFDALVDDSPDVAQCGMGHRLDLLVSQPYNAQAHLGPNTIRVSSTAEAIRALNASLLRKGAH